MAFRDFSDGQPGDMTNVNTLCLPRASSFRVAIEEHTTVNRFLEESFLVEWFVKPSSASEPFMFVDQPVPVAHVIRSLLR